MRRFSVLFPLALMAVAACGSDASGPSQGTLTNGTFRATVDGTQFRAVAATVLTTPVGNGGTIIAIGAGQADNTAMGFAWIDQGPGAYPLGTSVGANASYSQAGAGWAGPVAAGGTGTITVTTRTANRVAGTFSFVLPPISGSASGNKVITNGSFDLTF